MKTRQASEQTREPAPRAAGKLTQKTTRKRVAILASTFGVWMCAAFIVAACGSSHDSPAPPMPDSDPSTAEEVNVTEAAPGGLSETSPATLRRSVPVPPSKNGGTIASEEESGSRTASERTDPVRARSGDEVDRSYVPMQSLDADHRTDVIRSMRQSGIYVSIEVPFNPQSCLATDTPQGFVKGPKGEFKDEYSCMYYSDKVPSVRAGFDEYVIGVPTRIDVSRKVPFQFQRDSSSASALNRDKCFLTVEPGPVVRLNVGSVEDYASAQEQFDYAQACFKKAVEVFQTGPWQGQMRYLVPRNILRQDP